MQYPKPLFDYVIILPDAAETNSMLPEELNPKPKSGVVKKIGIGKQCEESGIFVTMQVKEGDRVMFSRLVGAMLNVDGAEHLVMKQTDLLLIL